jgi:hypothetical protein
MIVKTTEQPQFCQGCSEAHNCQRIYAQLGNAESPSVTPMVIVAFLVPILAFVAALGVSGRLLRGNVRQPYETPVAFVIATCVTGGFMLAVRAIARRRDRNKRIPDFCE